MNDNIELLNYIHQNADMGQATTKQLIEIIKDSVFKKTLESQYNEYKKIFNESEKIIEDMNQDAKNINPLSRASTYTMINLKTLMDKSPSHISEMMIQGSTMGIIDMSKKLNDFHDVDKDVYSLGNQLLKFEQNNIEELKPFLN